MAPRARATDTSRVTLPLPSPAAPPEPVCLRLSGELDLFSVNEVEVALMQALRNQAATSLTIDLTDVTFIDLAALRLLVRARHRVAEVVLVGPSPMAVRVLNLAGLDDLVRIRPAAGEPVAV